MSDLWSEEAKYAYWLTIERAMMLYFCNGDDELKKEIENLSISDSLIKEFKEEEKIVKHDVLAFVNVISRKLSDKGSSLLHKGLTSSDIVDTAMALRLVKAIGVIQGELIKCIEELVKIRDDNGTIQIIGRTHGQYAIPMTINHKINIWLAELIRNNNRVKNVRKEIMAGKLSGPVGTRFGHINQEDERSILNIIGLDVESYANQVVQRDRYSMMVCILAIIASSIEKFSKDLWGMARSDVGEISLVQSEGQKGSSSMPHKVNPWQFETIWGLARMVRSHVVPMIESNALWHERDISNSSVERFVLPDITTIVDYMLRTFTSIIQSVRFNETVIKERLNTDGRRYLSALLLFELQNAGIRRERAYALCDRVISNTDTSKDIKEAILEDEEIVELLGYEIIEAKFGSY
jgi:adenylosuccinate lyase